MINMKKNGFTLVEIIIGMAIGAVIMLAVYASMNMAQKSSASVGRKVATQQDARAVLDLMATEIRMASYNPTGQVKASTIPTGSCSSIGWPSPLVPANKGILVADPYRILIAMDLTVDSGGNPVIPASIGDSASEDIEYSYVGGTTKTIFRNIGGVAGCSGDTAILGGAGSATMVGNGTATPVFQYFDNTDAVTTSIPAIRRIRITIVAETENKDSLTNQVKTMTYTTDVLVKNHVLSHIW
ncbi:MAG: hypothetical protein STSR0002_00270 [Smithella sp.]|jgi:prepilin-type N-terminal cleavage/methylation domain-containing protein